jgi:acyl-coenzyme A thioesterase PaaI-like protein
VSDDLRARLAAAGADLGALVGAVRRLIDATVTTQAPPEVLRATTAVVEQALAGLAPFSPATPPPRYAYGGAFTGPHDLMPFDPIMGRWSPLAPPLELTFEDGKAVGRVRFETPWEGPPGCVHGGVIALAFDQVLNVANLMSGSAGPTKSLAFRFRRPTPLRSDLVFEGWQERTDGNRVHARGRLRHGDVVTVEAEGTFVVVPPERVMQLLRPR